ncbi:hypothetical protein [Shewanella sp. SR44-3]|uniref:hypothetical protein n=1 Tax=Shewanella sp. SR44-3 TaxID=2760936 RepID=UPI0015F7E710|nr:hypothetical protein [Shewanella sp. SR44-3]MBB1270975.1 hypothetical protein [Shewanella sp. SR44-3]
MAGLIFSHLNKRYKEGDFIGYHDDGRKMYAGSVDENGQVISQVIPLEREAPIVDISTKADDQLAAQNLWNNSLIDWSGLNNLSYNNWNLEQEQGQPAQSDANFWSSAWDTTKYISGELISGAANVFYQPVAQTLDLAELVFVAAPYNLFSDDTYELTGFSNVSQQTDFGSSFRAAFEYNPIGGVGIGSYDATTSFKQGDYVGGIINTIGTGLGFLGIKGANVLDNINLTYVGQSVNNLFGQSGAYINGKYIRTVPADVSQQFQGMGYLDPLTNTFKNAPVNQTMAVDHIYPVKYIQELQNFDKLTVNQQSAIIQDTVGIGNFQPLPKTFNSSKGSSLDWNTYKGQSLHPVYQQNLIDTELDIQRSIQRQINLFNKQNKGG